ncbi:MAG: agmatine deiminase family protein, partial [Sulfurimonas sp.]|nr:agmatine deiminase family protein [Sulfurimonas sp.]
VAEFAPMGGVLIAYPGTIAPASDKKQLPPSGPRAFGIPNELIVRMQQLDSKEEPVRIFIMCDDDTQLPYIIKNLEDTAKSLQIAFDPNLLSLVPWDTDTFWTRDYGPWWIKNEKTGYYGIAKHVYTSLGGGSVGMVEGAESVDPNEGSGIFRPNDDAGATKLSDWLNAPIRKWNDASWNAKKLPPIKTHNWYFTGLLDVGGNYMVTGDGIIASSYLVATQNELPVESEEETTEPDATTIENRMEYIMEQCNRFLGTDKYIVLTDPTGTYIGHIDCWGKFLAPRKVLIAQSQDKKTNEAFDGIADFFQKEGFEVFRVMCQDMYVPIADTPSTTAAYTNSLILNNCVYVPIAGGEYKKFDDDAIAVYRKALPSYEVIGILGKPEFPWLGTDAMHCRTRGVPREVVDNWLKSQTQPLI